jgi:large subunit ribosomal protein L18
MTTEKRQIRNTLRVKEQNKNDRPILSVFKSNKNISVQLIDVNGKVLVTATSASKENKTKLAKKTGTEIATSIGEEIAKKAVEKNIKQVAFNKGSNAYTGRVKALADGARANGLDF